MGKDWKSELTLERKDNHGNYCEENCYWATRKEQARNRRNNLYETYNGKTQLVIKWAEEYDIPYHTLHLRLYRCGWSVKKALTTPVKRRKQ